MKIYIYVKTFFNNIRTYIQQIEESTIVEVLEILIFFNTPSAWNKSA